MERDLKFSCDEKTSAFVRLRRQLRPRQPLREATDETVFCQLAPELPNTLKYTLSGAALLQGFTVTHGRQLGACSVFIGQSLTS